MVKNLRQLWKWLFGPPCEHRWSDWEHVDYGEFVEFGGFGGGEGKIKQRTCARCGKIDAIRADFNP